MTEITISALMKHYGETVAVNRVTLNIADGEFLTLLGSSGCGKTTTLRCVAGLETPDEGEIYFDGQSVTSKPPHERSCGMVFQSYALFPHLTVEENLAYPLMAERYREGDALVKAQVLFGSLLGLMSAGDRQRIEDALERVDLGSYAKRHPGQLSGGQQQRVALARALINRPKVLLFDEPLGALDAQLRVKMREEIRRIQREAGITTLYVTHDQEEALAISDRIAVMRRGNLAQLGTPEEIYRSPRSRFVAEFIGLTNIYTAIYTGPGAIRPAPPPEPDDATDAPTPTGAVPAAVVMQVPAPPPEEPADEETDDPAKAPERPPLEDQTGQGDDRTRTGLSISIVTPDRENTLPLYITAPPRTEGLLCAAVKPENIRFVDPVSPPDRANRVRGKVALRMFMGNHVRYTVRCGAFDFVVVRPDGATRAEVDDMVTLEFAHHDTLVLEDEA